MYIDHKSQIINMYDFVVISGKFAILAKLYLKFKRILTWLKSKILK